MPGTDPAGMSWFDSMPVRFEKRFSRGYLFDVNYTWSKFMEAVAYRNETA